MAWLIPIVLDYLPEIVGAVVVGAIGYQVVQAVSATQPTLQAGIAGFEQLIPLVGTMVSLAIPIMLISMFANLFRR